MACILRLYVAGLCVLKLRFAAIALGLMLGVGASVVATPASAQGFGWLGKLFGGQPPPPAPQAGASGDDRHLDGSHARPRHRVAEPSRAAREKDRPPPKNASVFVYVIGDAFGQNLASGLDEALADRQDVAIIHRAKGSTGLAATDGFDWPKAVDAMLAAGAKTPKPADTGKGNIGKGEAGKPGVDKSAPAAAALADSTVIDVAVMMIGSNDRQVIRLGGAILKPGTPEWTVAYSKRVMAIDEAFRNKGIPLIWVGVPIARDDGVADDMAALNDIYREAAAKTGTVYVDSWEAFSDDDGEFRAFGPDITGQLTRLRTADGVYFTKAGSRKLAHFVEVHVRRALDGKTARPFLPETTMPGTPAASVVLARKSDIGPISNLAEPPLSRGGELAYRADAQVETAIVKGAPRSAPAGRADELKWPASGMPTP